MTDEGMQRVLDDSASAASPFTSSFLGEDRRDAIEVAAFINAVRDITIATVRKDGGPHAAPTICACLDGTIYFTVHPEAAVRSNLRRDSRVAFTISDGHHSLIGRGTASRVGDSEDAGLMEKLRLAAGGRFTPQGWRGEIWAIEALLLFAT